MLNNSSYPAKVNCSGCFTWCMGIWRFQTDQEVNVGIMTMHMQLCMVTSSIWQCTACHLCHCPPPQRMCVSVKVYCDICLSGFACHTRHWSPSLCNLFCAPWTFEREDDCLGIRLEKCLKFGREDPLNAINKQEELLIVISDLFHCTCWGCVAGDRGTLGAEATQPAAASPEAHWRQWQGSDTATDPGSFLAINPPAAISAASQHVLFTFTGFSDHLCHHLLRNGNKTICYEEPAVEPWEWRRFPDVCHQRERVPWLCCCAVCSSPACPGGWETMR